MLVRTPVRNEKEMVYKQEKTAEMGIIEETNEGMFRGYSRVRKSLTLESSC